MKAARGCFRCGTERATEVVRERVVLFKYLKGAAAASAPMYCRLRAHDSCVVEAAREGETDPSGVLLQIEDAIQRESARKILGGLDRASLRN